MSLQWTLIAFFLYAEIALTILLILPIISAPKWQRFFKSKFLQSLGVQAHIYFYGFLIILVLFFVDSIREMRRYSYDKENDLEHGHLDAELQHSMKLFRAQRNFYITGFTLFLYLVIRRLVLLISTNAQLIAEKKASLSQAQSASRALESMMAEQSTKNARAKTANTNRGDEPVEEESGEKRQDELSKLRLELAEMKESSVRSKRDLETMKRQSKSLTDEYDRLSKEYQTLEAKYQKLVDQSGSKKDD